MNEDLTAAMSEGARSGFDDSQKKNTDDLVKAGLFALGWIMGKGGIDAEPVLWLARALKNAGADSSHVEAILERRKA